MSELRTERLHAAQLQRIASAAVAITKDELDDMRRPGSKFATAGEAGIPSISLADQCTNMMERVRAAFPAVLAVPAPDFEGTEKIAWHGKVDTKTHIREGGGDIALGKLKALLRDETRPWFHGAAHMLLDVDMPAEEQA